MKGCSISLAIKEVQKYTMRYHCTHIRLEKNRTNLPIPNTGNDMEYSEHCQWGCKMLPSIWKMISLKVKYSLPYDQTYWKESKTYVHREICT